jgi:hypothetical protein
MPRPRKPTIVHRLEGTWRPDRHAGRQEPPAGMLLEPSKPPKWLSKEVRAVWREVLASAPPGLYGSADAMLVGLYATAIARYRSLLVDPDIPARELRIHESHIALLGAQLALSPLSRTRFDIPSGPAPPSEPDEFTRRFGPLKVVHGGAGSRLSKKPR